MSFLQGLFGPPNVAKLEAKRDVPGLINALRYDESVCQAGIHALGRIGNSRAVEPLVDMLDPNKRQSLRVRAAACEALGQIGDVRAVRPLLTAHTFDDGDRSESNLVLELHKSALDALLKIGRAAVESLVEELQSGDIAVRAEAAVVLGRIGDARAVEPLIAVLKQDNRTVRYCACQALGKLGDARAVEPLIAALKDDDLWMRHVACEALGKLGDARAVEPLIAGLKHEDFEHCAWPFDALQKLSDSRAVEPLAAALEDPDWNVREDAAKALTELGVPNDAETRAWFAVSVRDWRAAVALGSDALEPLAAALKHPDGNVREGATWALGDIGDARAVKPLMAALENGGPGSLQIRSVVAALEKLYRSGTLAASDQQLILNQRDRMARRHYDFGTLGGCGSSPSHSDSEFGLEF